VGEEGTSGLIHQGGKDNDRKNGETRGLGEFERKTQNGDEEKGGESGNASCGEFWG